MAPRDEHGSSLSAQRAFVVHLGPDGGGRRRRFRGRVEHLSSGESTHFSSLESLLAFFTAVLGAAPGASSDDRSDRPRRRASAERSRPTGRRREGGSTPSAG